MGRSPPMGHRVRINQSSSFILRSVHRVMFRIITFGSQSSFSLPSSQQSPFCCLVIYYSFICTFVSHVICSSCSSLTHFLKSDHNKMSTYDFIIKRRREQTESEDNNNEKHSDKKALLSTSYFFACCSTKIERMKRSRKVHDESSCKNLQVEKKKWFSRNITVGRHNSGKMKSVTPAKEIESVDGAINSQNGLTGKQHRETSFDWYTFHDEWHSW